MIAGRTVTVRRPFNFGNRRVNPGETFTLDHITPHGTVVLDGSGTRDLPRQLPGNLFIYPPDIQPRGAGPLAAQRDPWVVAA